MAAPENCCLGLFLRVRVCLGASGTGAGAACFSGMLLLVPAEGLVGRQISIARFLAPAVATRTRACQGSSQSDV